VAKAGPKAADGLDAAVKPNAAGQNAGHNAAAKAKVTTVSKVITEPKYRGRII
jgi:hypothetical protein